MKKAKFARVNIRQIRKPLLTNQLYSFQFIVIRRNLESDFVRKNSIGLTIDVFRNLWSYLPLGTIDTSAFLCDLR